MPELSLGVLVTRGQLSLGDLDVNDHLNYYVSATFLGGQVSWAKSQVESPFMDGSVTTQRHRQVVSENITIEALAGVTDTTGELFDNVTTLVEAFSQDTFQIKVTTNTHLITYSCEASDYQVGWDGPRQIAKQIQVVLNVPRQPIPVVGGF